MAQDWRIVAGSVAGLDHAKNATCCEDSFAVRQANGTLILAVADGGSRLQLSAVGASLAATLAVSHTQTLLNGDSGAGPPSDAPGWHDFITGVMKSVLATFAEVAGCISSYVPGAAARDLGTTLTLVVAATPWLAFASIGDGFAVVRSGADHLDLLLPPDSEATTASVLAAEPGRTTFITSPGATDAMRIAVGRLPDLTGIAVSTDGLRELSLVYAAAVAQYPHEGFFRPIFERADSGADVAALLRLLASERVCELTTDDKTLVVAVRP
jgi:hypothetical protein